MSYWNNLLSHNYLKTLLNRYPKMGYMRYKVGENIVNMRDIIENGTMWENMREYSGYEGI